MKILFVASECAPLAKVGGLADVAGSLPKALRTLGIDVRIALPKYDVIDDKKFSSQETEALSVPFNGEKQSIVVRQTNLPGSDVPVYLLDHPQYFGNGGIYLETDASSGGSNAELNRFGLFSRAIPELIKSLNWKPDIIHCHDWQTGALPVIIKTQKQIRTLFTIHNLAYQGIHPHIEVRRAFGDTITDALTPHPHKSTKINFLASALHAADRISTVSPTYAQEITTPANGQGLDTNLKNLPHPPIGILNGIDTDYWNPATDQFLTTHFNAPKKISAAKIALKKQAQTALQLPLNAAGPLVVMVSRLTEQKGFDILIPALQKLLPARDMQCIILATGDKKYAAELNKLAAQFPDKFRFAERFDEPLAHLLYAAGDFFLMPSRFEPCGLGQMIAMRYGTIPIATAVGGLKDTVKNFQFSIFNFQTIGATGFVCNEYSTAALIKSIETALSIYQEQPQVISRLRANDMTQNFSWKHSANEYIELYQDIIKS
ncbi:MAG: glycogen/starch synthase [Patescibacteria group bacterium]